MIEEIVELLKQLSHKDLQYIKFIVQRLLD